MGFARLVDILLDGIGGLIWDLFSPFLTIATAIYLATISGRIAIVIIKRSLHVFWYSKPFPNMGTKRVKLKDSPLFMACLQKIKDGELNSVYINPHMACFNFSGDEISEASVLDFQKQGYEPIDGRSIRQYLNQLELAARKQSSVKKVIQMPCKFKSKSFLIFQGNYGGVPGTKEVYLSFTYRTLPNNNLKSFQIK